MTSGVLYRELLFGDYGRKETTGSLRTNTEAMKSWCSLCIICCLSGLWCGLLLMRRNGMMYGVKFHNCSCR